MSLLQPRPLAENSGLAFPGERIDPAFGVPAKLAALMLGSRNPHGKPNADVLRETVSAPGVQRLLRGWQIDFPQEMSEPEAALYEYPFQHLIRTINRRHGRWWFNQHARPALRAALARHDRYLASPVGAEPPGFVWLDATLLPDSSLVVVARDDDFTHGVLLSHLFALWWREYHSRRTPAFACESFPFPWPPGTLLSALTAAQEEQRHALARAARSGEVAAIDPAVAAAYSWPAGLDDAELLERLRALHLQRVG